MEDKESVMLLSPSFSLAKLRDENSSTWLSEIRDRLLWQYWRSYKYFPPPCSLVLPSYSLLRHSHRHATANTDNNEMVVVVVKTMRCSSNRSHEVVIIKKLRIKSQKSLSCVKRKSVSTYSNRIQIRAESFVLTNHTTQFAFTLSNWCSCPSSQAQLQTIPKLGEKRSEREMARQLCHHSIRLSLPAVPIQTNELAYVYPVWLQQTWPIGIQSVLAATDGLSLLTTEIWYVHFLRIPPGPKGDDYCYPLLWTYRVILCDHLHRP